MRWHDTTSLDAFLGFLFKSKSLFFQNGLGFFGVGNRELVASGFVEFLYGWVNEWAMKCEWTNDTHTHTHTHTVVMGTIDVLSKEF